MGVDGDGTDVDGQRDEEKVDPLKLLLDTCSLVDCCVLMVLL